MKKRTLRFESLEERQLLAVTAGLASLADLPAPAPVSAEPSGYKVGDVYIASTADADGDGFIGPAEFSYMSNAWFSTDGAENWNPVSDIDGDGFIGPGDFSLLSAAWFASDGSENWDPRFDIDGDGFIGPGDFTYLSANWFKAADSEEMHYPA